VQLLITPSSFAQSLFMVSILVLMSLLYEKRVPTVNNEWANENR